MPGMSTTWVTMTSGPTARRIAPFATVHRIENNSDNSEQNDDETDNELPELDGY